jgi:hypothetical protein
VALVHKLANTMCFLTWRAPVSETDCFFKIERTISSILQVTMVQALEKSL